MELNKKEIDFTIKMVEEFKQHSLKDLEKNPEMGDYITNTITYLMQEDPKKRKIIMVDLIDNIKGKEKFKYYEAKSKLNIN